ncbi:Type II secretion system (T2SS)-associated protein Gcp4 [Andalucia godoyi]|uniref:Type II secretion system (T2SS)-associated protein Gcp4 n=1 Tax=Andalucia godoyi TaxID=505711 RepID=A0A8K0F0V2_ANDGO|nr:Type II secretion system (T2SS)-associated protein Gcp4 [Andalucia godoyi]|eukprot:ANDGO_05501.mRNA.1 Type II secretion system (T2SS)-associated protein Gcp4
MENVSLSNSETIIPQMKESDSKKYVFVRTKQNVVFVPFIETDTFEDIRERVSVMTNVSGSKLLYCGQEVEYDKPLLDYNIRHTGFVVHWQ